MGKAQLYIKRVNPLIQPNEIVMLLLGLGTWIFVMRNRANLSRLPSSGILLAGFYVLLASWFLTVLEGFFWNGFFNLLEHVGYALGSVLSALWCWKVFKGSKDAS
jgi:hypothetical protein